MKIEYTNDEHFYPNPGVTEECYDCTIILSNGMRFRFCERYGKLELRVDGVLVVEPAAANAINLERRNF